jgi:hypothetical protein
MPPQRHWRSHGNDPLPTRRPTATGAARPRWSTRYTPNGAIGRCATSSPRCATTAAGLAAKAELLTDRRRREQHASAADRVAGVGRRPGSLGRLFHGGDNCRSGGCRRLDVWMMLSRYTMARDPDDQKAAGQPKMHDASATMDGRGAASATAQVMRAYTVRCSNKSDLVAIA